MARTKDELATALISIDEQLGAARANYDSLWQDLSRYLLPFDATFTESPVPGQERTRYILDSTGPRSLELFASYLHTTLNNPSRYWFGVTVPDPSGEGTNDRPRVRRWRESVRNGMLQTLERAKIYLMLHSAYLFIGSYGTAVVMSTMRNFQYRLRSYHLSQCNIREGETGFIDSMFRTEPLTPRQAKQRWPDKDLGRAVEKEAGKNKQQPVHFLHCVFPTTDEALMELVPSDKRELMRFFPFASVWVQKNDRIAFSYGGFEEFPYVVPRWYTTAHETWGRSAGMTALPDVRMINRMTDTTLRGAEKIADPPLKLPDGALVSPVRMMPGGLTFTDGDVQIDTLVPPGASRLDAAQFLIEKAARDIRNAFFVPLFFNPDDPVKTATQVLQEAGERNRAASPMLVRMEQELLSPLIKRNFKLQMRAGLLPRAPEEVTEVDIEYFSPLAGSRREEEGLSILRLFEQLAPWGQIDSGVFDEYNMSRTSTAISNAIGVPETIYSTEAEKRALRQARERQAQQDQMAQSAPPMIDSAANLIKATSGAAA